MTDKEIIRMSREVWGEQAILPFNELKLFAALVRAESTKEDLEVLENLRKETIAQCEAGMIEAYQLGRAERKWVDLTCQEVTALIMEGAAGGGWQGFAERVQAAYKEKNK